MKMVPFLVALLIGVPGCGGDSVERPAPGLPNRLQEAELLRVEEPTARVFRSQAEWTAFWDKYVNAFSGPGPIPAPEVDFERDMLIGVFAGNRGLSGCSNLAHLITHAEVNQGIFRVEVVRPSGLGPCAMIVYPLDVMIVPQFDGRVEFVGFVPE